MALLTIAPQIGKLSSVSAAENQHLAMVFGSSGSVLGDDDSRKEDERDEDDEKEDDHQEKEREEEREHEDEREDESEKEDEDETDHQDSRTEETIKNANGTTTYIKRESDAEKTEIELKTYDASGKLVEERKLKKEMNDDQTQELELEQHLFNQGDLQELKIKSKTGKELEITVKKQEEDEQSANLEYNPTEQKLKISNKEQERHLTISPEEDHFLLDDGNQSAKVGLPLTIDAASGEVFVETVVGLVRVGISPDRAREIISASQGNSAIDEAAISLEEGGNGIQYKIAVTKQERLFGLFPVTVESEQLVDGETGELSGEQKDFPARLVDFFSF